MNNILNYILMGVGAVLAVLILLQPKGTALGSAFGQEGSFYGTLRGAQKKIFWLTCFFGGAFIILALVNLINF